MRTSLKGVPTNHIHSHVSAFDMIDLEADLRLTVQLAKSIDRRTLD